MIETFCVKHYGTIRIRRGEHRAQDLRVLRDVLQRDCYRLADIKLPPDPLIVDVGAHVGAFARACFKRFPGAVVVAIEACPENVRLLQRNLAGRATVVPAACTYESGPLVLLNSVMRGGTATGGSVVTSADGPQQQTYGHRFWLDRRPLGRVTLEDILRMTGRAHIDLLKLDCEGSEFSILGGTASLGRIHRLVGEFHDGARWFALLQRRFRGWTHVLLSRRRGRGLGTFYMESDHVARWKPRHSIMPGTRWDEVALGVKHTIGTQYRHGGSLDTNSDMEHHIEASANRRRFRFKAMSQARKLPWATAIGSWGDCIAALGNIRQRQLDGELGRCGVLYYGFEPAVKDFIAAQPRVAECLHVVPHDREEYQRIVNVACSTPRVRPENWLPLLSADEHFRPRRVVQTHVDYDLQHSDSESPRHALRLPAASRDWSGVVREFCGTAPAVLVQPYSVGNSVTAAQHWPYWRRLLASIAALGYHVVLVGQAHLRFTIPDVLNLCGKTASMVDVFTLSNLCAGTITTSNSLSMWTAANRRPGLVLCNSVIHQSSYFSRWIAHGNTILPHETSLRETKQAFGSWAARHRIGR